MTQEDSALQQPDSADGFVAEYDSMASPRAAGPPNAKPDPLAIPVMPNVNDSSTVYERKLRDSLKKQLEGARDSMTVRDTE